MFLNSWQFVIGSLKNIHQQGESPAVSPGIVLPSSISEYGPKEKIKKPRNKDVECERKACLICVSAFICFFGAIFFILLVLALNGADDPSKRPKVPEQRYVLYNILPETGHAIDNEWMEVLAKHPLAAVELFYSGLAVKYKVLFGSGHVAMCKPVESISYISKDYTTVDFDECCQEGELSRADRLYQGWAEIAAFHLDRAMELYRKPPIVGRVVTSRELYIYNNAISTRVRRGLPEHPVYVALHAWMQGLDNDPPRASIMAVLSHHVSPMLKPARFLQKALEVSDILVFDVLMDDHDRKWEFNWKATRDGVLLQWDSGLGFRHGPFGTKECLDILCGHDKWKEINPENNSTNCQKICVFRKSLADKLRLWNEQVRFPNERHNISTLATKWRDSLLTDPLHPIFKYGLFWDSGPKAVFRTRIRFDEYVFYRGISYRQQLLINWMEECSRKYGEENVFIDL